LDNNEKHIGKILDKRGLESLFREYFSPLNLFAQKYIHDVDGSKEIVQDVFVTLWKRREEMDLSKSMKPYLFTSVHNRCLNYIRDQKKIVHSPIEEMDMSRYVESRDFLVEEETLAEINRALSALPDKCRKIFMMSRFDGKKYREIAAELGISIKTVETQMSRALKHMKKKLAYYLSIAIILLEFICYLFFVFWSINLSIV